MPYEKNSSEAFSGGSGQMAVISELLQRKCNAAIPMIDVGMDVFAFQDQGNEVARIQVKTARGRLYQNANGYSADFRIPIDQLRQLDTPSLYYALAVRLSDGWGGIIVISRENLQNLLTEGIGPEIRNKKTKKSALKLYLQFRRQQETEGHWFQVRCGEFDLTEYLNAWNSLPPLKPPVPIE